MTWRQTAFDLGTAGALNHDFRPPIGGWSYAAIGGRQVSGPADADDIFTRLGQRHRKGDGIASNDSPREGDDWPRVHHGIKDPCSVPHTGCRYGTPGAPGPLHDWPPSHTVRWRGRHRRRRCRRAIAGICPHRDCLRRKPGCGRCRPAATTLVRWEPPVLRRQPRRAAASERPR